MHCVSNAIQDQLLLLLVILPSLGMSEKTEKVTTTIPDHFDDSEDFFSELFSLDNGLKSQQGTVQLF